MPNAKEKTVSHLWCYSTKQLQRNANQLSKYIEILCILVCFPDHIMCGQLHDPQPMMYMYISIIRPAPKNAYGSRR